MSKRKRNEQGGSDLEGGVGQQNDSISTSQPQGGASSAANRSIPLNQEGDSPRKRHAPSTNKVHRAGSASSEEIPLADLYKELRNDDSQVEGGGGSSPDGGEEEGLDRNRVESGSGGWGLENGEDNGRLGGARVKKGDKDEEGSEEDEDVIIAWEAVIDKWRKQYEDSALPALDVQERAELIKKYRIGGAFVHGFGVGHVYGVININRDPNSRGNPRALNESHSRNLVEALCTPGAKRDHESPIIVTVARNLLEDDQLEQMRNANPRDPAATMPPLQFRSPKVSDLLNAETELLAQSRNGRWMTESELSEANGTVITLRKDVPKADLLNGNHRVDAIVRIGRVLSKRLLSLQRRVQQGEMSHGEMNDEVDTLKQKASLATYRVEVYDADLPPELASWLVRNDDVRPAMGMAGGERAWHTAGRWDIHMAAAREQGFELRKTVCNKAFAAWLKELGPTVEDDPELGGGGIELSEEAKGPTKRGGARRRGDWGGDDMISKLFTCPLTMEMVLDTRAALTVYNKILRQATSVEMLREGGALLVTRFWLACRTLLQVFNVADGEGLAEAGLFIADTPLIIGEGYEKAIEHWCNLHSRPELTPRFLEWYTDDLQDEFDELYAKALEPTHPTRGVEWDDGGLAKRVREVFETMGKRIERLRPLKGKGELEWARPVGLAMRLLARLPIDEGIPGRERMVFCPAAAFPAKKWLDRVRKEAQETKLTGSITILECLLDKYLPIWTLGAQPAGSSRNANNWYDRCDGLKQIPMRLLRAEEYGSVDQMLQRAIVLLSDVRLKKALKSVESDLGDQLKKLLENCNVNRSSPAGFPILKDLAEEYEEGELDVGELEDKLGAARSALKDMVFAAIQPTIQPTQQGYASLRKQHDVLDLVIPEDFWTKFDVEAWVRGWNASAGKRYLLVRSVIAWGILAGRMPRLLNDLMENRASRHLLELCEVLAEDTKCGGVCWKGVIDDEDDRPSPPATPEPEAKRAGRAVGDKLNDAGENNGRVSPEWGSELEGGGEEPTGGSRASGGAVQSQSRSNPPRAAKTASQQKMSGKETRVPNKRTTRASQPSTTGRGRRPNENQADGQEPGPERIGGDDVKQEDQGSQAVDSTRSSREVSHSRSSLRSGQASWSLVNDRNPSHVTTNPVLPTKTYEYIRGCAVYDMDEEPEALMEVLERNEAAMAELCFLINSERQDLRESIVEAARQCINAPYGGYYAECGLAGTNSIYKDIFVTRVALILAERLNMTEEEALNEAVAIAASDGLFEADVARIDEEGSGIEIDLLGTFAKGVQGNLPKNQNFVNLGGLRGDQEGREDVHRLLRWMHKPRGIGRTEAETTTRGLEDAMILYEKVQEAQKDRIVYTRCPPVPQPSDPSENPFDVERLGRWKEKWDLRSVKRTLKLTLQPKHPGLSTGAFEDSRIGLPEITRGDMLDVKELTEKLLTKAQVHWENAQENDLFNYREYDPLAGNSGSEAGRTEVVNRGRNIGHSSESPAPSERDEVLKALQVEGGMRSPGSDDAAAARLLKTPEPDRQSEPWAGTAPNSRIGGSSADWRMPSRAINRTPSPAESHTDSGEGEEDAEGEPDEELLEERVEGAKERSGDKQGGGVGPREGRRMKKSRGRKDGMEYEDVGQPRSETASDSDDASEGTTSGSEE